MRSDRLLLLAPLLVAGCATRDEPVEQPVSSCHEQIFEQSNFTVCDPVDGDLRLFAAGPNQPAARRFADLSLDPSTVAFAMNAGMFDEDGRPIGMAVRDGKLVRKLNTRDGGGNFHLKPNGVFTVSRAGRAAIHASDKIGDQQLRLATQSGPMLVIDGKLHPKLAPDGTSRYVRNGVGVTATGRSLFVISVDAVSLGKFARFFRDGLKTPNALYFDGSVSSLWDPAAHRQDDFTELGPIIVAFRPGAGPVPGREGHATP